MELSALAIFAGALIIAAGSPGPSIAALVSRVLTRGFRDVLPFIAAMWVGEAIWLSFAVWGLASMAESFQTAFMILKWAGVAYLMFLAWKMWTAPTGLGPASIPERTSVLKMFAAGMLVTMGNPKIMFFYLALLPTIIDMQSVTLVSWAELTITMLAVLFIIDLFWITLASRARAFLKSPAALRIANRCSAGIMAGAATAIATR